MKAGSIVAAIAPRLLSRRLSACSSSTATAEVAPTAGSAHTAALRLRRDLDALAAQLVPVEREEKALVSDAPPRRRSRRLSARRRSDNGGEEVIARCKSALDTGVVTPAAAARMAESTESAIVPWWTELSAEPAPAPAARLLARQQEAYSLRLLEDRKLIWLRQQRELNNRLEEATSPAKDDIVEADDLPDQVVQGIFDEMSIDPAAELEERRKARLRDALAVHIEQLIACEPPRGFGLEGQEVRIAGLAPPTSDVHQHSLEESAIPCVTVVFEPPTRRAAATAEELAKRLNAAAPVLSRALARRHLLGAAPVLRFEVQSEAMAEDALETSGSPRSSLWHAAKRQRRLGVHAAMQSWKANMHW